MNVRKLAEEIVRFTEYSPLYYPYKIDEVEKILKKFGR